MNTNLLNGNDSLKNVLIKIEDKVTQAEKDRSLMENKLKEKGVEIIPGSKITSMIDKIEEVKTGIEVEGSEKLPPWATLKVENIYFNAASMFIIRTNLQCSSISNKIYSLGGKTILNNAYTNVNECYDTISNTWTTKENMISGRQLFTASVINNKIYCIGGTNGEDLNNNESYDTNSNTWTTKENMVTKRNGLTSSVADNKIYCITGFGNEAVNVNECYDDNSNTWTIKQSLNNIRFYCGSSTFDNKIYCIGGRNFNEDLNNNDCYDINTDIWTNKANMLSAKHLMGISTVNGKIYSIAGFTYKEDKATITTSSLNQSYDPIKNEWNFNKSMEDNIGASCSSVVNNNIYIMGAILERDTNNICYIP